ncbi:hypothetical protein K0M31_011513 [Melipona bicolor]|uniref:Uncharacterized protein n=1 Tax=Melipona bicolor TaxID=60889 RepID=A0AA40G9X4_9HYME|nr:hypothetical protein K0M31_011513 [Melipona bicolor]
MVRSEVSTQKSGVKEGRSLPVSEEEGGVCLASYERGAERESRWSGPGESSRLVASIGETSVIAGKVEPDEEIGYRRACERLRLHRRAVIRRAENINVNLSLSEVLSLLDHADDDEVLAGTSEENRKRALWQFYSTGMLTHSHSDGEFPIYSQGIFLRLSFKVSKFPSRRESNGKRIVAKPTHQTFRKINRKISRNSQFELEFPDRKQCSKRRSKISSFNSTIHARVLRSLCSCSTPLRGNAAKFASLQMRGPRGPDENPGPTATKIYVTGWRGNARSDALAATPFPASFASSLIFQAGGLLAEDVAA